MHSPKVEVALALVHKRCFSSFSFNEIAKELNVSTSRLRSLIKVSTGVPAGRYVKRLRMCRAQQLLETTFMSVKQIMAEVGCNDQSHFVRDFKIVFGVSPTQYRSASLLRHIEEQKMAM
jgi:transcriptional regulator GlxA family with amidase domain